MLTRIYFMVIRIPYINNNLDHEVMVQDVSLSFDFLEWNWASKTVFIHIYVHEHVWKPLRVKLWTFHIHIIILKTNDEERTQIIKILIIIKLLQIFRFEWFDYGATAKVQSIKHDIVCFKYLIIKINFSCIASKFVFLLYYFHSILVLGIYVFRIAAFFSRFTTKQFLIKGHSF
jgi:hypothetical protein